MGVFDTIQARKNTRSVKWDGLKSVFQTKDVLPMWVADMDFKSPQAVNEALMKRVEHGIYGYTMIDHDVKNSIVNWIKRRHHWQIQRDWLTFSPSVITSLHIAIQALTEPNDKVLIQTPVYTPFFNVLKQHNREMVKNPLVLQNNYYKIDFEDFEDKLKQGVKAFILCSPHNPVGRVWTRDELEEIARLCLKYDVIILTDEIHGDLVYPNHHHIPFASLSNEIAEQTITFMSPSKTFNLAGLQASYMIVKNQTKHKKLTEHLKKQGLNTLNTMGNTALEAAYNHGESWLDELISVLHDHRNYVTEMLESRTKELKVINSEGTYLIWINCSGLKMDSPSLRKFMIEKAKVGLNPGMNYGKEGSQFMRMNIACPRAILEEGVNRIITAVNER
ncbi:MalY/PatB family protein [Virgibacillus alimentarius]|uniref:cysteine-S-conjugate beta-lyase n=1 Tax=Virgibacillus alimentarius TaxID=698769 RepID=A0ABS4S8H6_9BACI|nr:MULTISPECIES: PatB family C-S lyase [Virgibacillus]MBP2257300.1 cystathionine beta-lyase [Virgibacillus alimentarius]HLR67862.1 PatB family C-S lyase [Virgibacillus sp.]